jgi:hypothetical protein
LAQAAQWPWTRLEKIMVDEGYVGADFEAWVTKTFDVELDVAQRPPTLKGFVPPPIRTHVCLAGPRYHPLSKDYENWPQTAKGWFIWLLSIVC